jgi:N-acetylmuramoyl-L-alanine amidase
VGPNYSRIVIAVEGEVKFDSSRLTNPDRIVLDLADTRLSPALVGKTFPVEDGFLRQIRVGQFSPTVTRVVLDVEKIEDYSVIPLPNPFRLVVDIHGTPAPAAAKAETRAPAPEALDHRPGASTGSTQTSLRSQTEPKPVGAAQLAEGKPKPKTEKPAKPPEGEAVETAIVRPPA